MDDAEAKARRHLRPNRGKNPNARWIVDEVVKKKPAPKKRRVAPKPEAPILEGETLCACDGAVGDDKTMAECEKCKTWQHVVCEFGVDDESALPEKYQCWRCRDDDADARDTKPAVDASADAAGADAAAAENGEANGAAGGLDELKDKVRRSVAEAWLKIVAPLVARSAPHADAKAPLRLALDIEAALYAKFGDRGAKDPGHVYRDQFRMLSFNLKDEKNAKLQADVATRAIAPEKFVTLSSAELRPPEMRKLADEIEKESLQESIIPEQEPPKEKVSMATAEVNMEPTFIAVDEEEDKDSAEEDEAMKEPLGPPPTADGAGAGAGAASPSSASAAATPAAAAPDEPVWQGRVRLGAKLDFAAAGRHLQAPSRAEWPQFVEGGSSLVVDGAVPVERATTYLRETTRNETAHAVASLVLSSPEPGKTDELYEYLSSRGRVGAVEHSSPRVKDAYILPVAGAAPDFLALDEAAKTYLGHLRAEHGAERFLLLTLILYK